MSSTSFGLLFQPKRGTGIYCATKLHILILCIGAYIHAHEQVVSQFFSFSFFHTALRTRRDKWFRLAVLRGQEAPLYLHFGLRLSTL